LVGAEAELALELQRRNAVGMCGHEIGRPEPDGQRQLRAMQDRPRRDRGLLAAGGALKGEGLAAVRPSLFVGTGRTAKARRPAGLEQPSGAGGLVGKAMLEVDEGTRKSGMTGLVGRI